MRIPSRLRSGPCLTLQIQPEIEPSLEVKLRVKPFRSIRFIPCLRCMGHGYFWTNPPQENPAVVFSREGALGHLIYLARSGRVSCYQYMAVQDQIVTSDLPDAIPRAVRQLVGNCTAWEERRAELASIGQDRPELPVFFGLDVADRVHEFLLESPELKTQ